MPKSMATSLTGLGPTWLERRRLGLRDVLGTRDIIHEQIYSKFIPLKFWDQSATGSNASGHGAVFSLEFSPEGSLLVAACEKRSVLVFDPLMHREIYAVENAHDDCVNCIKFLDSKTFATCSDDFTVALWDSRNLSQRIRSFKGHTNWVKNIEYAPQDDLLITSGFDGNVLTWEMNKYRESGMVYKKMFTFNGLMRTCLTPDASKMIISTTSGFLIIIHNLDLNYLSQDLKGFRPNIYRLMQLSQAPLPTASEYTHLFRGYGKRNRVEFVTDFPEHDDAEVVSSLQIHPDGHSAISRNVSNGELSEWSCIHNIEEGSDSSDISDNEDSDCEHYKPMYWSGSSTSISTTPSYIIQHTRVQQNNGNRSRSGEGQSTEQRDLSVSPGDVWEALVAIQEARVRRERDMMFPEFPVRQMMRRNLADAGILVRPILSGPDGRVFETRLLSAAASAAAPASETQDRVANVTGSGNASQNENSSSDANAAESRPAAAARAYELTPIIVTRDRRKSLLRQRYCSLYRRSLVGQYDRTSISRKPIYKLKFKRMKVRRPGRRTRLHTNYELNETWRLQNELDERRNRAMPSTSGTGSSRRERRSDVAASSRAYASQLTARTLVDKFTIIKNHLNSMRDTVNQFGDRLSSTMNVLRSLNTGAEGTSENVNNNNNGGDGRNIVDNSSDSDDDDEVVEGRNQPHSIVGNCVMEYETILARNARRLARRAGVSRGSREGNASSSSGSLQSSDDYQHMQSGNSRADSPSRQPNSERTILMGVFRAGNEDGVRGTSMRRHNIAAVTVTSSSNSASDGHDRMRTRMGSRSVESGVCGGVKKQGSSVPVNRNIYQNVRRLTHYIEEPNLGHGFIKELCISPDGRVICSPFGNGVRLLSFSPAVQDLSHCYPTSGPIPLHELSLNLPHKKAVVSTKFSPYHNLLVSGCLAGRIAYYHPIL